MSDLYMDAEQMKNEPGGKHMDSDAPEQHVVKALLGFSPWRSTIELDGRPIHPSSMLIRADVKGYTNVTFGFEAEQLVEAVTAVFVDSHIDSEQEALLLAKTYDLLYEKFEDTDEPEGVWDKAEFIKKVLGTCLTVMKTDKP